MQCWVSFLASASAAGSVRPFSCSRHPAGGKLWRCLHQPLHWFLLICAASFSPRGLIPVVPSLPLADVSCLPGGLIISSSLPLLPCDSVSQVPVCASAPLLRGETQGVWGQVLGLLLHGQGTAHRGSAGVCVRSGLCPNKQERGSWGKVQGVFSSDQ